MSTSEALSPRAPLVDGALAKRFVIACGLAPATLLAYDAWRGQLGVNDVNFALRTTGLVGLVFLTLTLVITPLRRLTGARWLIAARRNLGVLGFAYIAAHFVIFFAFDRAADVGSTLTEIVERVYLWFGTGSLVIMIPLAMTSTDGMVTRLGAKRWKLLHRLAYVAVLFGVIHFYLLVKADVTKPLVFSVVFGGLMLVRLIPEKKPARPPRAFWSGELAVAKISQETHDTKTFRFTPPAGVSLPAHTAGQYLTITLPIDGKRVKRSYTISSPPTRSGYLEITVKRAANGYASQFLHDRVTEGDRLHIAAPAGKFVFDPRPGAGPDRVVLIGGGVGITPMMSVIRALTDRAWTGEIHLFYSVRTRADVIFGDELARLAEKHATLKLHISYSTESGNITRETIEAAIPDLRRGPILVCGPAPMMTAMRALLVGMGIPDADILEEAFVSPGAAGSDAPVEAVGDGVKQVQFAHSKKSVELPGGLTVLEAAEDCGVSIPFECRSGVCGQCKTKLVSGRVVMEAQDALTAADKASGLVLACQARPVGDVVVDA